MRIAIINDVHWGNRKSVDYHFESLSRFFDNQFIPYIMENKIEYIVIAGDWYESRQSIPHHIQRKSIEVIERLSGLSFVRGIYFVAGNHDLNFKNNYTIHNLSSYQSIPKVEIKLGFGSFIEDGIYYHSYDTSERILYNLSNSNTKGKLFICHLETDGNKVISYINNNFTYGLSGHIHIREEHKNFTYLPSVQENTTDEYKSLHGFAIYDTILNTVEFVENIVSGKFKKIVFGDDFSEKDIYNNFITTEIDLAVMRKLTPKKTQQDILAQQFRNKVIDMKPAYILDWLSYDSENISSLTFTTEKSNDTEPVLSDVESEIYDAIQVMDEFIYKEEMINEIKKFRMITC